MVGGFLLCRTWGTGSIAWSPMTSKTKRSLMDGSFYQTVLHQEFEESYAATMSRQHLLARTNSVWSKTAKPRSFSWKTQFCRAGRARTIECEKSWLNVFEELVTPLRSPGKKLWVDLIRSFGSKLVASHGGESFAFSSRRLWKKWNWSWWWVMMQNKLGLPCSLCIICVEFIRLSESKFAYFNPTNILEI